MTDEPDPLPPPESGEWSIWPDQRITRRKLFHIVLDPEGRIAFRSRLLWQCLDFLEAEGVERYRLCWSTPDNPELVCVKV